MFSLGIRLSAALVILGAAAMALLSVSGKASSGACSEMSTLLLPDVRITAAVAMADSALKSGAHVHGVIPGFLNTVEHGHKNLSRLEVVDDMRERKHRMLLDSDAVVSLPGGSGTFEEVFEVLTLKRLGQFLGPIVLVNTNNYFDRLVDFLEHSVNESFMSRLHLEMWSLIDEPEQVLDALSSAKSWNSDAFKFAAVASTP